MTLKAAMWVHGTITEVANPNINLIERRAGRGASFTRLWPAGSPTTPVPHAFYIPITTPVVLDDHRPQLGKILVLFRAGNCSIKGVEVWDGRRNILTIDGLNLFGDHGANIDPSNNWVIEPAEPIRFGLGIIVNVLFEANVSPIPLAPSTIEFFAAGADFLSP